VELKTLAQSVNKLQDRPFYIGHCCLLLKCRSGLCPGYEGDASDAEDDTACSATPSRSSCGRFPMLQTALLDFWLILRPELDKVRVFFQTRFVCFWLLCQLWILCIYKHQTSMTSCRFQKLSTCWQKCVYTWSCKNVPLFVVYFCVDYLIMISLSVCLLHSHFKVHKIFVHANCCHGLVLLRRQCDTLWQRVLLFNQHCKSIKRNSKHSSLPGKNDPLAFSFLVISWHEEGVLLPLEYWYFL